MCVWLVDKKVTLMIISASEIGKHMARRYADLPSAMIPRMEKAVPRVRINGNRWRHPPVMLFFS